MKSGFGEILPLDDLSHGYSGKFDQVSMSGNERVKNAATGRLKPKAIAFNGSNKGVPGKHCLLNSAIHGAELESL